MKVGGKEKSYFKGEEYIHNEEEVILKSVDKECGIPRRGLNFLIKL